MLVRVLGLSGRRMVGRLKGGSPFIGEMSAFDWHPADIDADE